MQSANGARDCKSALQLTEDISSMHCEHVEVELGWLGSVVVGRREMVIERWQVRLPAGALPGSLGQLSLPSLRGR